MGILALHGTATCLASSREPGGFVPPDLIHPPPTHPPCRQRRIQAGLVAAARHYDVGRLQLGVFRVWRAQATGQLRLRVGCWRLGRPSSAHRPPCSASALHSAKY